jgi:cell division protein FtsI/penicillin-binding protein 2
VNSSRHESRLFLVEIIFLVLLLVIVGRLIQVQIIQHNFYLTLANKQWHKQVNLPAPRGDIFDRRGAPLAISSLQYRVACDPRAWRKFDEKTRGESLTVVAELLQLSHRPLRKTLLNKKNYAVLRENLILSVGEREQLIATGFIHLERKPSRLYPLGTVGAAMLGLVNAEGRGVSGLEAGLQEDLAGIAGKAVILKDDLGRPLISSRNQVLTQPRRGKDLFLTIDHKAQVIADLELGRAVEASGAQAGSVVILDPHTGDILALASWPAPTSRDLRDYSPEQWALLPIQGTYEPGSTMKALSSITLMEKGKVTLATQEDAENGRAIIDGFPIRDDRKHFGYLTFREAFTLSSNICFAKLSARVTDEHLFGTLQSLGFGNRYGLMFPGEETGRLRKTIDWSPRSKMTLTFGQEISVTPLQITSAFGALATGGVLMKPHVVKARRDPYSEKIEVVDPVLLRRVCKQATADTLLALLGFVVDEGTGSRAKVAGIPVGGKTGTAQKFEQGTLKQGKYMASFIGVAPLENPQLVVGIFIDEPEIGKHHGGQSAAPAFARIIEHLALATDRLLSPEAVTVGGGKPVQGPEAPFFLELNQDRATELALSCGLKIRLVGRGERVISQKPAPGCILRPNQVMVLGLGDSRQGESDLPDLTGLSLRTARRIALQHGYPVIPRGEGQVVWQGAPDPEENMAIPLKLEMVSGGSSS